MKLYHTINGINPIIKTVYSYINKVTQIDTNRISRLLFYKSSLFRSLITEADNFISKLGKSTIVVGLVLIVAYELRRRNRHIIIIMFTF